MLHKKTQAEKAQFPLSSGASAQSYFGILKGTRDDSSNWQDGGNDSADIEEKKCKANITVSQLPFPTGAGKADT